MPSKVMDICTRLFTYLQNPELVASFQKFCGVHGHERVKCNKSEKCGSASNRFPKVDDQNNCAQCQHRERIDLIGLNGYESNVSFNTGERNGKAGVVINGSIITKRHLMFHKQLTPCKCEQSHENGVPHNNGVVPNGRTPEELSHGALTEDVTNILEPEHWTNTEYDYTVKYTFLYYLFKLASGVGNETFYTLVFPYVIWNMDSCVGRRMSMVWFYIMFVGQATKDLIKLPRPASPPVVRLEKRYEYEYGMPSTHAMIGAAFPFSLLTIMQWRYPNEFSFEWALAAAFVWMTLVAASRLYMGMHTVMDILAGLAYTVLIVPPLLPLLSHVEYFSITYKYAPLVVVPVTLGFALCYPKLDRWSTTRGDTTVVMSTGVGILLGCWFDFQLGRYHDWEVGPPYKFNLLDSHLIWTGLLRFLIGSIVIVLTRTMLKPIVIRGVCAVLGVDRRDVSCLKQLKVELPYKYITYTGLAFSATFLTPNIFAYLGVERASYLTEIL